MSWQPGVGVDVSMVLGVGSKERVDLRVGRANHVGYLTLGATVEIKLEPGHLETLRDQLPRVLADLGVLDAARNRAADAGSRAAELETYLRDETAAADQAGDVDRAHKLRVTADKLTAARSGLDGVLDAVDDAARLVDDAAEDAHRLLGSAPDDPEAA